jgi:hypothetical protein
VRHEPTPRRRDCHETSVGKNTCNCDGVVSNSGGYFELISDGDGYTSEPGDGTAAFKMHVGRRRPRLPGAHCLPARTDPRMRRVTFPFYNVTCVRG